MMLTISKSKEMFMSEVIKNTNWTQNKGRNILLLLDTAKKIERNLKSKSKKIRAVESKFAPIVPFHQILKRLMNLNFEKILNFEDEPPKN